MALKVSCASFLGAINSQGFVSGYDLAAVKIFFIRKSNSPQATGKGGPISKPLKMRRKSDSRSQRSFPMPVQQNCKGESERKTGRRESTPATTELSLKLSTNEDSMSQVRGVLPFRATNDPTSFETNEDGSPGREAVRCSLSSLAGKGLFKTASTADLIRIELGRLKVKRRGAAHFL